METAKLLVIGTDDRRTVDIDGDPFTIGRTAKNRLQVNERNDISAWHAEIVCDRDRFFIHDRNSKYGTYLNGRRVQRAPLAHQDRIHLASFELPELVFLQRDEATEYTRTTDTTELVPMVSDLRLISRMLEGLRVIGTAGVLTDLLNRVADDAIALTDADRGFIMLANERGSFGFRAARGRGRVNLPGVEFRRSHKIPDAVMASGKAQILSNLDLPAIAKDHQQTIQCGVHSATCVPLPLVRISGGIEDEPKEPEVIGVLYVDSKESKKVISPVAVAGLEALAAQAAAAIENANLYHEAQETEELKRDLRFAWEIQKHLLPQAGQKGAFFEVAGHTIPCRMVGGDLYDYFTLPNGSLGFALADVAGKGSAAALMATLVHGTFMTLAYDEQTPAEALSRVNRVLLRRDLNSRFVTFHYAMLSADGRLISCNAGHNYPLIVRRDGTMETLEVGGMPVGLFDTSTYEDESAQLEPGDTVLVFSDGLIDAMDAMGRSYGDERVADCLRRNQDRPAAEILECMLNSVDCFVQEGPQADDLTALIIRYQGL
jgi:serine phosphatase RsbU (regulator of sigma subunit)